MRRNKDTASQRADVERHVDMHARRRLAVTTNDPSRDRWQSNQDEAKAEQRRVRQRKEEEEEEAQQQSRG